MAVKTVATLTNTLEHEWTVTEEGTGTLLVHLDGVEVLVLGMAAASLVADHGYPQGTWVRWGPGRYAYTIDERRVGSAGTSKGA
jgi:hypothetical protein